MFDEFGVGEIFVHPDQGVNLLRLAVWVAPPGLSDFQNVADMRPGLQRRKNPWLCRQGLEMREAADLFQPGIPPGVTWLRTLLPLWQGA